MVDFDLCVITARLAHLNRSHLDVARAALEGGAPMIQLRDKDMPDRELWRTAADIRRLAQEQGALFIVNDRVDISLAVGADGVHLGQDDLPIAVARQMLGPKALIGASVADSTEAQAAQEQGATYLSVGSVYNTPSKPDAGEPVGIAPIAEIKRAARIPLLAIGGITCDNLEAVIRAGADGVAVIAAVAEAEDMAQATSRLRRRIREARRAAEAGAIQ